MSCEATTLTFDAGGGALSPPQGRGKVGEVEGGGGGRREAGGAAA